MRTTEVGMKVDVCERNNYGIKSNKKTVIIGQAERLLLWLWFVPSCHIKSHIQKVYKII
jgi:hypothetical protein